MQTETTKRRILVRGKHNRRYRQFVKHVEIKSRKDAEWWLDTIRTHYPAITEAKIITEERWKRSPEHTVPDPPQELLTVRQPTDNRHSVRNDDTETPT